MCAQSVLFRLYTEISNNNNRAVKWCKWERYRVCRNPKQTAYTRYVLAEIKVHSRKKKEEFNGVLASKNPFWHNRMVFRFNEVKLHRARREVVRF